MKKFKTDLRKTNKLKWLIFIFIEISLLIYILRFSDWNYFLKFILFIPIFVFLIFDFIYLRKENRIIIDLNFGNSDLITTDNKNIKTKTPYKNLKYSIRKGKYDKEKTEIELKEKKNLTYKTYARLHIKNWNEIYEIENELVALNIPRVKWEPQTLWGKYWGFFIDFFFVTVADGDIGMIEYQESLTIEDIEKPLKEKNNA